MKENPEPAICTWREDGRICNAFAMRGSERCYQHQAERVAARERRADEKRKRYEEYLARMEVRKKEREGFWETGDVICVRWPKPIRAAHCVKCYRQRNRGTAPTKESVMKCRQDHAR